VELLKLSAASLADAAEQAVQEYIRENDLKPGDPLPKEQEFAEQFGVSRTVMREALSRLRLLGLIESRKRRGMVVAKPDVFAGLTRLVESNLLDADSQQDLLELRVMIELGMVEFAYASKTDEEVAELERIVDLEETDYDNQEHRLRCDVDFHTCLYGMTKNAALCRLHELLVSFFRFSERGKYKFVGSPASHRDILNAMKSESAEEFSQKIASHMSSYLPGLLAARPEQRDEE
jgi:DNA-binding FadR family transcriptional regulator